MNDTLRRGAWDKKCTDIMYVTIEFTNYPVISYTTKEKMCECRGSKVASEDTTFNLSSYDAVWAENQIHDLPDDEWMRNVLRFIHGYKKYTYMHGTVLIFLTFKLFKSSCLSSALVYI